MNKDKFKEFAKIVDVLLWKEWDPIGCGVPADEYTTYAYTTAGIVWRNENKELMLEFLHWVENDYIGLDCTREQADLRNIPVVDKIVELVKEYKI